MKLKKVWKRIAWVEGKIDAIAHELAGLRQKLSDFDLVRVHQMLSQIDRRLESIPPKAMSTMTQRDFESKLEQARWRERATRDFTERLEKSLAQERDNAKKLAEINIKLDTENARLQGEVQRLSAELDKVSP